MQRTGEWLCQPLILSAAESGWWGLALPPGKVGLPGRRAGQHFPTEHGFVLPLTLLQECMYGYWDVYLQISSLLSVVYAVVGERTRGQRGDCPLSALGGACMKGTWGDVKEGVCPGNTGFFLQLQLLHRVYTPRRFFSVLFKY